MKLVDLAFTPAERKEEQTELAKPSVGEYPYGLTIRLDEKSTLQKLGLLDDLPDVGEELNIQAVARVVSVSMRDTGDDDERTCVELQICRMAVADAAKEDPGEDAPKPKSRAAASTVASYYGSK